MQGFLKALADINNGAFIEEALVEMNSLVMAVRDSKKKGKIILELDIEPLKGDDMVLTVSGITKIKLPDTTRHTSIMYPTDNGNLSRKDPRQPDMFSLKSVDSNDEKVDPETGEVLKTA